MKFLNGDRPQTASYRLTWFRAVCLSAVFVMMLLTANSSAQNFKTKFSLVINLPLKNPQMQWVDANNDSLLDVLVTGRIGNEINFALYKNVKKDSLKLISRIASGYQTGKFFLVDINRDNRIDIVFSGQTVTGTNSTRVFFNKGNFNFQKAPSDLVSQTFNAFRLADLNNDGQTDLVGSDQSKLYVFRNKNGLFTLKFDTTLTAHSLLAYDFDRNVIQDITYSGLNASGKSTIGVLLMGDQFKILSKIEIDSLDGMMDAGDLNGDGLFDVVASGKNSQGNLVNRSYQNDSSKFSRMGNTKGLDSALIRIADFNSDGKADISYFGKSNSLNWIKLSIGDSVSLPANKVVIQDFGDYDRDGDLDLVQWRSDSIVLMINSPINSNIGPSISSKGIIAAQFFNRTFFYWPKGVDDHTDSLSLTYDLKALQNKLTVSAAEFDSVSYQRLLVTNGNSTDNFSLQRITNITLFEVQGIDNSFTVQTKKCSGSVTNCVNVITQNIAVCKKSGILQVQLKSTSPNTYWFSLSKGFLGKKQTLTYNQPDSVFSFVPNGAPGNVCATITLYNLTSSPQDTIQLTRNLWNCKDATFSMTVDSQWQNVNWNPNSVTIISPNTSTYKGQLPITFLTTATNKGGCALKEIFNLKLSSPLLQLANPNYQIAKGASVQLNASGANSYQWSPSNTLDNSTIASPTASPLSTTTYTVIAKDSLGCQAYGSVTVDVLEMGFIPTLFSPNGDGKNDELKIYGLTTATQFKLIIYSREGNVMYETEDVTSATTQGWSGSTNGQPQPPGTYLWKVEGNNNLGKGITLNGKKSGVILLVR